MNLKQYLSRIKLFISPPDWDISPYADEYIMIYSHPRSGTHLLSAFLGKNFYKDDDLLIAPIQYGHWANRMVDNKGDKHGKLFGNHYFPHKRNISGLYSPSIYIYRNPGAVAYSLWKSPNFKHPNLKNLSLSEFLKKKIDWIGSPKFKCRPKWTIAEHHFYHVKGWLEYARNKTNIHIIKYEDLSNNPYDVYLELQKKFFPHKEYIAEKELDIIKERIGLHPNAGTINAWKDAFNAEEIKLFTRYETKLNKLFNEYKEAIYQK